MSAEDPNIERRREIAAKLGYTLREDLCVLAGITDSTEESWRKRGTAPAYTILGNSVLYVTDGLADRLKSTLRGRADGGAKALL